jgi:CBS domain-containing protein
MRPIPQVVAVMTPFPYAVDVDESLRQAREMMRNHEIRHLPVSENGRLVGVISDRDIKLMTEPSHAGRALDELRVRDACVMDAYAVNCAERLDNVLLEMAERQIGSALIEKNGKLVGIFTMTDACRCFGELLRARLPGKADDDVA